MASNSFDSVSRLFSERRLSRRAAIQAGGATAAAGAFAAAGWSAIASAQDATPAADGATAAPVLDTAAPSTPYLFVQSFESGTIMPKEGVDGRFTVTLQHGLGQTLYFSDRPERVVGAASTPDFLQGLGFPEDNPPNAAMVIDDGMGGTNLAVVELFNPLFDPTSPGVTYDITVLQDYEDSTELGFTDAPLDLSSIPETFGSAHLFIDDCPDKEVYCTDANGDRAGSFGSVGHCYYWSEIACLTCGSSGYQGAVSYWSSQCNSAFAACNGQCYPRGICSTGVNC